jgi:hypothetical protein
MYWSPVRLLVWRLNPACSHERYTPKSLLTLHRKGQLAGCSLGYRLPVVVPHFDNHPLATRPVYMDDNTRPHLSRAVAAYFQSEAVTADLLFKVQYRVQPPRSWMTASTLRRIPPVRRRMSFCDSCCHSRCNALPTDECFAQEVTEHEYVVSYSQGNVLTGHHCVLEIIWSVISWCLSYHLSFKKTRGVLNFFLCVYIGS